jgi:magnesium transporter
VDVVARPLADDSFFWLDLRDPSEEDLHRLAERLGFHPLAVEDSLQFGQRAKLEEYDDFVFLVVFGWAPDADGLVEVHIYYSQRWIVTVRRDTSPSFEELHEHCSRTLAEEAEPILLLHHIVDGLVDSFLPPLERINDRLEAIEDAIVSTSDERYVAEILTLRRRVAQLRKALGPERDLFGRVTGRIVELPGMTQESSRYFRDVYDHLTRLTEMLDVSRELMSSALDVYLSAASNRLGSVTKQLTVIASIFLPLTFITGFFGQNFGWMVTHVDTGTDFLVFAIGLELLAVVVILLFFKRRGWF